MTVSKAPAVNVKTLATLLNVSERRVYQMANEGIVIQEDRGKYDLFASVQGYIRFLQKDTVGQGGSEQEYRREKTGLAKAQRERAELELQATRGALVPKESVHKEGSELGVIVKSALMNIPSRLASELATISDPFEIHKMLSQEINEAMRELNERYRPL